ncbi:MAG: hypothetical protein ABW185_06600 [Sedimenticola sp.]
MKTIINDSHIETLEQVRQLLDGASVMEITISSKSGRLPLDSRPNCWIPSTRCY